MKKISTKDPILKGIKKVADIVGSTLGPAGKNVVIGRPYQSPLITNDGVRIAEDITLEDEFENLGAQIMLDAARTTNKTVGDGTTTTIVLTHALIEDIYNKYLGEISLSQLSPMEIRRIIEKECKDVVNSLTPKQIKTKKELEKVALVSSEDTMIAETVANLCHELGEDGKILIEDGYGERLEMSKKTGFDIPFGTESRFAGYENGGTLQDVAVYITNETITSQTQLNQVIQETYKLNKNKLFVFCPNYEKDVLQSLYALSLTQQFMCFLIKIPSNREDVYQDIGSITESKVSHATPIIGKAQSIQFDKDSITITNPIDLTNYIKSLKLPSGSEFEDEQRKKRIAKLSKGVGVIKVWAKTPQEQEYLKLKVEDTVCACFAALKGGVVKGGGIALKETAKEGMILYKTLHAPYERIMENAGKTIEIPDDIIDPYLVVKNALETACSIAGIVITTSYMIVDKNKEEDIL